MITNNLSTLKIHELTREQYNRLEESNTVQPNEIYLIKNDSQPVYTVNGISPDENGNVQLPIKNDSLPIYTVNGVSPDENGNIQIAEASLDTIIPETLSISKGGTGATTAAEALTNLGLTATTTELNYVDGVTSNIQDQLNGKLGTGNGTFGVIASGDTLTLLRRTGADGSHTQLVFRNDGTVAIQRLAADGTTWEPGITLRLPNNGGLGLTSGAHYGTTLPSEATSGRIFFKKVT